MKKTLIAGVGGYGDSFITWLEQLNFPVSGMNFTYVGFNLNENTRHRVKIRKREGVSEEFSFYDIPEFLGGFERIVFVMGGGGVAGSLISTSLLTMAKSRNIAVGAVMVMPFRFEGNLRLRNAEVTMDCIHQMTKETLVINNAEKMTEVEDSTTLKDFFTLINYEALNSALQMAGRL